MSKKIKVLIAKPGLDGHDRGALVVAQSLRDAGMEVVYTGIRQSPEDIVESAMQEDVDAIGISCLSGAHLVLCKKIMDLLKARGMKGKAVFCGGIIPQEDQPKLKKLGIAGVFTPGTPTADIVRTLRAHVLGR